MKILLIEDEPEIAAVVKEGLEEAHYPVDLAADGVSALALVAAREYALIILDLMLPRMDGWRVCQEVRARRNTVPILMLTARDAATDRVRGLEMGADDYLPKPFDFTELLARVRSLLRRDRIHKARLIRIADLEIDTELRRVVRAGQVVALTNREYTLLETLASREGQVITREMIQEQVWMDEESYSNTVDVHVRAVRKKIDAGHDVKLIQSVYGLGYVLKGPEVDGNR